MYIYAHRGSSGTHPENTLAAFHEAARLPIHGVEFDVHLSKDGKLVIIHDEKIDRTSNGKGYVKDLTLAELKNYDFGKWFSAEFEGERIPELHEVLEIFQDTSHHINIELKTDVFSYDGIVEKVLDLIQQLNLESRLVISSFNHDTIREVKQLAPHIETAILSLREIPEPFDYLHALPADAFHLSKRIARLSSTEKVIRQDELVRVFTVNKTSEIDRFKKIGVQAVFTDYPEKMFTYLHENKTERNFNSLFNRWR